MSAKIQDAEQPWLQGYTLRRQTEVIARVRAAGYRDNIALAIASWLTVKAMDLPDDSGSSTRSRYRKILREIGAPERRGGRVTASSKRRSGSSVGRASA